jgi:formylglycine-generating enzyme required for sulfatase activity
MAGLAPELRRNGVPVCVLRDPGEPKLAQRLVAGVLDVPTNFALPDETSGLYRQFADWMFHAQSLAGKPPVLILDQLDDFIVGTSRGDALARLGPLMAATAQRLRGESDYCCRWVLAYRGEFHHDMDVWLRNVLAEAKAANLPVSDLPHNLRQHDRFDSWPLPMLGASLPGIAPGEQVRRAFLAAIERPLALESSPGRKRYRLQFIDDGAERLAEAFEQSRKRDPNAPLVPELQAVLRHLIDAVPEINGERALDVSRDPDELQIQIQNALAEHLRRALEKTFPYPKDERGRREVRTARSEALVVLSQLTDAQGRRLGGLTEEAFVRSLPSGKTGSLDGLKVLSTLASPDIRLIVRDDNGRYSLSHDSMAKVVRAFVDQERAHGNLELDPKVLELRHFVTQRSQLFARFPQDESSALVLSSEQHTRIQELAGALLLDEEHHRWWDACTRYRGLQRGRRRVGTLGALVMLMLLGAGAAYLYAERAVLERNRNSCGSERFGASTWCLPYDAKLGFISIDAGQFLMGSNRKADFNAVEDEIWNGEPDGLGKVNLPIFYIAKYEVTVAQFKACLDSMGCSLADTGGLAQSPDHPIASLTWREAEAYCRWLDRRLRESSLTPRQVKERLYQGWKIQLPTEAQWEKAARGSDGRIYSWGNEPKPGRANYRAPNVRSVGTYACPECPYADLVDMTGNVHEWTRSIYRKYPYNPVDGRNNLDGGEARVMRGGAYHDVFPCRAARRYSGEPHYRNNDVGFRVVLSSF